MKGIKIKRVIVTAIVLCVCYLLQCMLFPWLELASVKPNLMLILTASYGFMRGPKDGMLVGFFSGLLMDIQFGNILGFYALLYLLAGYVNGLFQQMYYAEDIKLPLALTGVTEFIYGLVIYLLMFMLRSEFNFLHYLRHIIIPELIYTIVVTLGLYPLFTFYKPQVRSRREKECW